MASRGEASLHRMALIESRSTRGTSSSQGFIGRSRSIMILAIVGLRSSSDNSKDDEVDPSQRAAEIGWQQRFVSHDRGSRSRLDRGPIATRSWPNYLAFRDTIASISWTTIVVRSWPSIPSLQPDQTALKPGKNSL